MTLGCIESGCNQEQTFTMTKLEERLHKAIEKLDKLKALQQQKLSAARHREKIKSRKSRDHHIYRLGGLLEKMGLDALPDETLLGSLALLNKNLSKPEFFIKLSDDGRQYLEVGKKLERPVLPEQQQASPQRTGETAQQEPMVPATF